MFLRGVGGGEGGGDEVSKCRLGFSFFFFFGLIRELFEVLLILG